MPRPERPLGPGDDAIVKFAADLRALRDKAGSPPYRVLAVRAHFSATSLSEAAAGRKLPSLAVTLAYVRACGGDDIDEWTARWRAVAARPATTAFGSSPYQGLHVFESGDTTRFAGRDDLLDTLSQRLREARLVEVFGASGSGKSSLLRAGLAARHRRALVFTPGRSPLEECAIQLARSTGAGVERAHADLTADPGALHRLVREALPDDAELLIVVDQFEQVRGSEDRDRFVEMLIATARAEHSKCRIVLGVRADFSLAPALIEAIGDARVEVRPMIVDELTRAITEPARQAGCRVETALVSRLVGETLGQPGILPFLSHVLLETWRRRRGNTLTVAAYEETGGIGLVAANAAEHVYRSLSPTHQIWAKRLFLRLAAPDRHSKNTRRVFWCESWDNGVPEDVNAMLERLIAARVLTADARGVELSHARLGLAWQRLDQWLAEDRDGVRIHQQLTDAAHGWLELARDSGALYRGARLATAAEWVGRNPDELSSREQEFLEASLAAEVSSKRSKLVTALSLLAIAAVAILLAVLIVVGAHAS